ncbi:MAG: hypothetical protein H6736_00800 [Alphaproteobacteria bacterium]|nr:hypothetical protein [Alphaproteobacteria bacterium]MCB9690329.1 hypothetical protein [Alphaproteobacteria bacterium]
MIVWAIGTLGGCHAPQLEEPNPPLPSGSRWRDIVAWPCVLDEQGVTFCWGDEAALPAPQQVAGLVSIQMPSLWLRGLDQAGTDHILSHVPEVSDQHDPGTFSQLSERGGIADDGTVELNLNADCRIPGDWVLASEGGSSFLDSDGNVALILPGTSCDPAFAFTLDTSSVPISLVDGVERAPGLTPASIVAFACVLDHMGVITCDGDSVYGDITFDEPPYRRLVGAAAGVCAQRWDHVVVCSDGDVYDWGPLRDLAVGGYGYRQFPGWSWESPGDWAFDYSVCAITEDDRIVCDGLFYSQEVLDALEDL